MNPQRPPQSMNQQKVKLSNSTTFFRFVLGGLGFGAVDMLSKQIFGEGQHRHYRKEGQKMNTEANSQSTKPTVLYSKDELTAKLNKLSGGIDQTKLQEAAASADDSTLKNCIFGFISANFGGIFHAKLNGLFRRKNYKSSYKMAISPFTFLPYYLFCGIYDHLPMEELLSRVMTDALPLFVVRIVGDFVRHKKFSTQEQQAIAQGAQFVSSPRLLAFHMICRGVYIFALDTLYHKRVSLF